MEDVMKDKRFSHIAMDHRFRRIPRQDRKVKIDKRFKGMFSDKKFKMKYTIDKRGRPLNLSTNEDLHKFYELDSEEEDSDESDEDREKKKLKKKPKIGQENKDVLVDRKKSRDKRSKEKDEDEDSLSDEEAESSSSDDEEKDSETDVKGRDLARGEGNLESSSDDDDEEEEEKEKGLTKLVDGGVDHKWNELDREAPEASELGLRLAVCNLDWDRIKAVDIFVLLSSFLPTGGALRSVKIYPSEFGKTRMAEEAIKGPTELVKSTKVEGFDSEEEVTEDAEGTIYHREKLRQYQLTRLKYYYAVAEFDSVDTANTIYGACDGTEYESSATRLDLRFIPDDMTFDDQQELKSVCTTMPTSNVYKPSIFFTSALCQSKVDLTWDETDHDRLKVTMRAPSKMDTATEDDFKAYLASSSGEEDNPYGSFLGESDDENQSEESESEEKQIDKYRALLQNIQETEKEQKDKDIGMEVTWEPGLKQTTEKLLKKKEEEKDSTTWEKYLIKKKEKRQKKREERQMKAKEEKKENKVKEKTNKSDREDVPEEGEAAFSDDDLPGGVNMSEFMDVNSQVQKGKKKKKKRVVEKLTEEEKKEKETKEAELSLLMMDEKEDDRHHFSLNDLVKDNTTTKKKKRKFKKKDLLKSKTKSEDDFKVDVGDERFTAMYSSHVYNLDPTAPEYKRTKGMEAIVEEKLQRSKKKRDQPGGSNRKRDRDGDVTEPQTKVKRDSSVNEHRGQEASLESLIKSVKTKTQRYNIKSKSKR
ncbi:ESF1 homolog [Mizuhopecten yessoensis]|uniref:ESF1-like n=1 Tax=Mizuhopecten yessoensis TaxID=6573 RepID=A0A210QU77_MIZYE|nr:ESF1 homolog [Mizuhopecten yessoensis]OWF52313.1 ESF1-like [Mizuhopecten yessoensis]